MRWHLLLVWGGCLMAAGASTRVLADSQSTAEPPSPRAAEAMELLQSDDPYARETAFLRLEALREPSTVEVIKGYLDHRDQDLRAQSLRALAAIEGASAVPVLLEKLARDRHPTVRIAALLGLEPFQKSSPEILPALLKALRDRHSHVRITAVDIVSRIDDPKAREAILARHKRERRRDVQRVLEAARDRIGR